MSKPLVSCLMATADRPMFIPEAMRQFYHQSYKPKELVILDDGEKSIEHLIPTGDPRVRYYREETKQQHGAKMNRLVQLAQGEIMVVHDDDDFYAGDRLTKLALPFEVVPTINLVGTSVVRYANIITKQAYLYDGSRMPFIKPTWLGAPAFTKTAWLQYGPWNDKKCGSDYDFLKLLPQDSIIDLADPDLMICSIHLDNAASKNITLGASSPWTELTYEELPWKF